MKLELLTPPSKTGRCFYECTLAFCGVCLHDNAWSSFFCWSLLWLPHRPLRPLRSTCFLSEEKTAAGVRRNCTPSPGAGRTPEVWRRRRAKGKNIATAIWIGWSPRLSRPEQDWRVPISGPTRSVRSWVPERRRKPDRGYVCDYRYKYAKQWTFCTKGGQTNRTTR